MGRQTRQSSEFSCQLDQLVTITSGFQVTYCIQRAHTYCTMITTHTVWQRLIISWTRATESMRSSELRKCLTLVEQLITILHFYHSSNKMAEFTMDERELRRMVDLSMREGARVWVDLIVRQTPRDWDRPPQPISRKDGKKPKRKGWVVSKNGQYYRSVTWALKSSIWFQKAGASTYDLGVRRWPASAYAKAQEFGTVHIPPRPYVRKAFIEGHREIIASILYTFYQLSK